MSLFGIGFAIVVLIFSIIIHEVSHGAFAYYLGDPTAKYAGRLTLNPIKHLDLFGSIILPLFLALVGLIPVGWAKPVPINPNNFRDKKWGELKVSFAGPGSNLIVALFFGLAIRLLSFLDYLPLNLYFAFSYIILINIFLALFNLVPIPPLDGSHILFSLLPYSPQVARAKFFLGRFGFLILVFLIYFFPPFFRVLSYVVSLIFVLFSGTPTNLL